MLKGANREGLDFRLYKYSDKSLAMNIDFINSFNIDLNADQSPVTGGANDAEQFYFDNPLTGTIKISTKRVPLELVALAASDTGITTGGEKGKRVELTCAAEGTLTLDDEPVAGTLYVYKKESDAEGTPVATTATSKKVTVTGAKVGDKYIAYYFVNDPKMRMITFSNKVSPCAYIICGDTHWKDNDTVYSQYVKAHKAVPKKAFSFTYQGGTGDPNGFEMEFKLAEDEDGQVWSVGEDAKK